jgi:DNA-binding CsgD family transcriptional regulator
VARGLTTPHIALILGTSPLTVRNQLCRVFDKTRVASRAELATWVAQRSLARR